MTGTGGATFLYVQSARRGLPSVFSKLPAAMRVEVIGQYALDALDDSALQRYDALLLTSHLDQIHFERRAPRMARYLDASGTIVFNGPLVRPFLPELRPFVPLPRRTADTALTPSQRSSGFPVDPGRAAQPAPRRRRFLGTRP